MGSVTMLIEIDEFLRDGRMMFPCFCIEII
jgi:hypothetical protein